MATNDPSRPNTRPALPAMYDVFSASASEIELPFVQPAEVQAERDGDTLRRSGRARVQTDRYILNSHQTPTHAATPTPKGKGKRTYALTPTTSSKTKKHNVTLDSSPPPLPKPLPIIINGVTQGVYHSLLGATPAARSVSLVGPLLGQVITGTTADIDADKEAAATKVEENPDLPETNVGHLQLGKAVADIEGSDTAAMPHLISQVTDCDNVDAIRPFGCSSASIYAADLLDSLTMAYASEGYSDLDEQIARAALLTSSIIPSAPSGTDAIPLRMLASIERTEAVLELLVTKYTAAVQEMQRGGCAL